MLVLQGRQKLCQRNGSKGVGGREAGAHSDGEHEAVAGLTSAPTPADPQRRIPRRAGNEQGGRGEASDRIMNTSVSPPSSKMALL